MSQRKARVRSRNRKRAPLSVAAAVARGIVALSGEEPACHAVLCSPNCPEAARLRTRAPAAQPAPAQRAGAALAQMPKIADTWPPAFSSSSSSSSSQPRRWQCLCDSGTEPSGEPKSPQRRSTARQSGRWVLDGGGPRCRAQRRSVSAWTVAPDSPNRQWEASTRSAGLAGVRRERGPLPHKCHAGQESPDHWRRLSNFPSTSRRCCSAPEKQGGLPNAEPQPPHQQEMTLLEAGEKEK